MNHFLLKFVEIFSGWSERVHGAGHGGHVLPAAAPGRGGRAPGHQARHRGAERPHRRQQVRRRPEACRQVTEGNYYVHKQGLKTYSSE